MPVIHTACGHCRDRVYYITYECFLFFFFVFTIVLIVETFLKNEPNRTNRTRKRTPCWFRVIVYTTYETIVSRGTGQK